MRAFPVFGVCLVGLGAACAHAPKQPTTFAQSAAFHATSGSVYGILERDLDADGFNEALVLKRTEHGYKPTLYRQVAGEGGTAWAENCVGAEILGGELERLSWTTWEDGTTLGLVAATDDSPDDIVLNVGLLDLLDDCASSVSERVVLPRPAGIVIAPESVPAGLILESAGVGFRLIDMPRTLRLLGAGGEVELLLGLRERRFAGPASAPTVTERNVAILAPEGLTAEFAPSQGEVRAWPELTDEDTDLSLVLKPGEAGLLSLSAPQPIVALEVVHGCPGEIASPLALALQEGQVYEVGKPVNEDAFVVAVGRAFTDEAGAQHGFLALREPQPQLAVVIGPLNRERCLHHVKAYSFVTR